MKVTEKGNKGHKSNKFNSRSIVVSLRGERQVARRELLGEIQWDFRAERR